MTTTKAQTADALVLLTDLVKALDGTNWTSWQTTAPFDKELDAARAFLSEARANVR